MKIELKAALTIVFSTLLLFAGCTRWGAELKPPPPADKIWSEVRNNTGSIIGFKGKAEMTIETGFRSIPVNAEVLYIHPDWLTLRAFAPMGMKLVELSMQKQRFMVYSPFTNEFVTGDIDSVNFSRSFKLPIPNYDLRDVWHSLYSPQAQKQKPSRIVNSGKYNVLVYPCEEGQREIWIHRKKGLIYRESLTDSAGVIKRYIAFSRYKKKSGVNFPREIEIGDIDLGVRLTIETRKFYINPDIPESEMMISVPPEVNRIEMGNSRED